MADRQPKNAEPNRRRRASNPSVPTAPRSKLSMGHPATDLVLGGIPHD